MTRRILMCFLLMTGLWLAVPASAHNTPFSYIDLRLGETGIDATVEALAIDLAHDLPDVEASMLLTPAGAQKQADRLFAIMMTRFTITAGGQPLKAALQGSEPVVDKQTVRLQMHFAWDKPPTALQVHCRLFPYDPRHKTYLNVYEGQNLKQQLNFTKDIEQIDYKRGSRQSVPAVVGQFLVQGVYHIFTGPDHILFIVGLLLLGGTLRQLLKIVTAFTIAHSITLALSALSIVNPPPRIIEPTIALSIVFVGIHSIVTRKKHEGGKSPPDARLLFAFGFGFIHGFGFANALREMELPRYALIWSLFSFNLGVEVGQACIVLTVAPLLAAIHKYSETAGKRVVMAGSVTVILAGAFWFVQRVLAG